MEGQQTPAPGGRVDTEPKTAVKEGGKVPPKMAESCSIMAAALERAAMGASQTFRATALRQLWEVVAQARIDRARREHEERRAEQLREAARAAAAQARADRARRAEADLRAELLDWLRLRRLRLSAVPEQAPEDRYWKAGEGIRRAAAVDFKSSLSSVEASALANVRGALRRSFEQQHREFWKRSAEEPLPLAGRDSAQAPAQLGPRTCLRALERSWMQQRDGDVLLAVRLGDTLDVWDPFDDYTCPCDSGADPSLRPCTSCPHGGEGGAAKRPFAFLGAIGGGIRWSLGRGWRSAQ